MWSTGSALYTHVPQNHLENVLKHGSRASIHRDSDSISLGWAENFISNALPCSADAAGAQATHPGRRWSRLLLSEVREWSLEGGL